jgi:hypothetical protein
MKPLSRLFWTMEKRLLHVSPMGIPLMHQLIDHLCKELAGFLLALPYHWTNDADITTNSQQNCETLQDLHTITKRRCPECLIARGVTVLHNNACFQVAPIVPEYVALHTLEGDGHAS